MVYIKKIRIALVHDDFIQFGGAEKLFFEIIKELKKNNSYEIVIFSSIISPIWKKHFESEGLVFKESFLRYIPYCYLYSKLIFLSNLFYLAFQNFNFDDYDIVFSSSTRFGHSVITKPTTYHISYLNSPSRALWDERKYFFNKLLTYNFLKYLIPSKRISDYYSQQHSDLIISNSKNIKNKVKKVYSRNSIILFPFVEIKSDKKTKDLQKDKDYFLLISRLVSWKRIDFVIESFNLNQERLVILGDGPEIARYRAISNSKIEFKGYVSDTEKNEYFKNARALIFPQNEDFGITILEALNFGIPILYLNKGGAKEILNNKVGISFEFQDKNDLNNTVERLSEFSFNGFEAEKILKRYTKTYFINFIEKLIFRIKN